MNMMRSLFFSKGSSRFFSQSYLMCSTISLFLARLSLFCTGVIHHLDNMKLAYPTSWKTNLRISRQFPEYLFRCLLAFLNPPPLALFFFDPLLHSTRSVISWHLPDQLSWLLWHHATASGEGCCQAIPFSCTCTSPSVHLSPTRRIFLQTFLDRYCSSSLANGTKRCILPYGQ